MHHAVLIIDVENTKIIFYIFYTKLKHNMNKTEELFLDLYIKENVFCTTLYVSNKRVVLNKVAVIGANGRQGSATVDALLLKGFDVVGIVRDAAKKAIVDSKLWV